MVLVCFIAKHNKLFQLIKSPNYSYCHSYLLSTGHHADCVYAFVPQEKQLKTNGQNNHSKNVKKYIHFSCL